MRKLLAACTVAFLLTATAAAPVFAQESCADFSSQAAAQSFFEEHGQHIPAVAAALDPDEDGVACEDYDYSGDSGSGGNDDVIPDSSTIAPTDSPPAPAPLLAVFLTLIGGLAGYLSRRRFAD